MDSPVQRFRFSQRAGVWTTDSNSETDSPTPTPFAPFASAAAAAAAAAAALATGASGIPPGNRRSLSSADESWRFQSTGLIAAPQQQQHQQQPFPPLSVDDATTIQQPSPSPSPRSIRSESAAVASDSSPALSADGNSGASVSSLSAPAAATGNGESKPLISPGAGPAGVFGVRRGVLKLYNRWQRWRHLSMPYDWLVVLLIGLVTAVGVCCLSYQSETSWYRTTVVEECHARARAVADAGISVFDTVTGYAGLFAGAAPTRSQFLSYVNTVGVRSRHLFTVSWHPRITRSQRTAFEAQMSATYGKPMRITELPPTHSVSPSTPQPPQKSAPGNEMKRTNWTALPLFVTADQRDEYYPTLYMSSHVEEVARSYAGWDAATATYADTLYQAIDRGQTVTSPPSHGPRGNRAINIVTSFTPLYSAPPSSPASTDPDGSSARDPTSLPPHAERRANAIGVVAATIEVTTFISTCLRAYRPISPSRELHIEVADTTTPDAPYVLYRADAADWPAGDAALDHGHTQTVTLRYSDVREWKMTCVPTRSFRNDTQSWMPWVLLSALGLVTLLLSALLRRYEHVAQLLQSVEKANQAKSTFLSFICHELRNPLHAIGMIVSILLDTPLQVSQREFIESISRCSAMMGTIVNDVLDLSKIEKGKLELERIPFDLFKLVADIEQVYKSMPHGLAWTCTVDPDVPTHLRGDPNRLAQMLTNLLSNAIKFTPRGSLSLHISRAPLPRSKRRRAAASAISAAGSASSMASGAVKSALSLVASAFSSGSSPTLATASIASRAGPAPVPVAPAPHGSSFRGHFLGDGNGGHSHVLQPMTPVHSPQHTPMLVATSPPLSDDADALYGVWLKFAVRDTGIGIAKENIPRLFREYSQAQSSIMREFGGSGLGLSIVRSLAAAMNGHVSVASEVGRGSVFAFVVHLQRDWQWDGMPDERQYINALSTHGLTPTLAHSSILGGGSASGASGSGSGSGSGGVSGGSGGIAAPALNPFATAAAAAVEAGYCQPGAERERERMVSGSAGPRPVTVPPTAFLQRSHIHVPSPSSLPRRRLPGDAQSGVGGTAGGGGSSPIPTHHRLVDTPQGRQQSQQLRQRAMTNAANAPATATATASGPGLRIPGSRHSVRSLRSLPLYTAGEATPSPPSYRSGLSATSSGAGIGGGPGLSSHATTSSLSLANAALPLVSLSPQVPSASGFLDSPSSASPSGSASSPSSSGYGTPQTEKVAYFQWSKRKSSSSSGSVGSVGSGNGSSSSSSAYATPLPSPAKEGGSPTRRAAVLSSLMRSSNGSGSGSGGSSGGDHPSLLYQPQPQIRSAASAMAPPVGPYTGVRVLLVEDDLVNQKLARHSLQRVGMRVDVAGDGFEGVRLCTAPNNVYDVVLMDVNMPRMDGLQATTRLRQLGITTPIVALSAQAIATEKEQCLRLGMNGFISKPITPAALVQAVLSYASAAPPYQTGAAPSASASAAASGGSSLSHHSHTH